MLIASARAATRQHLAGCYTMAEIPPVDYVYGKSLKERKEKIRY
jgi:hypothetical protein